MTVVDTATQAMHFERFYLGCLAHASYLLGSQGEAVVVDPQRDVELYLRAAETQGLNIRHIFETHLHADFVSGHRELAERTGAKIYIGAAAGAVFPHVPVCDGFELLFGKGRITVLETPGHTPESICLLITDTEKSRRPWAVLTGDTLFLGDVGRPDLSRTHSPRQLAGMLYDSLHTKLMTLPDDVAVFPAHGAGSLCGRNMRAEDSSTIGIERLTNYALRIASREEFIRELTTNLPARPEYFLQDAEINRTGATAMAELPAPPALSAAQVKHLMDSGTTGLDVRAVDRFAEGHVPGSINIALSGQFASWAGTVLGLQARPVLIAESDDQIEEARVRLARVGIDAEGGYLRGGVEGWRSAGFRLSQTKQITVEDLHQCLGKFMVVDVRREPEWRAGHVEGAQWYPLDRLNSGSLALDKKAPLAVHCKSGYRSMIACSLLERSGFQNVTNVSGGLDAWERANLPLVKEG
jgi:glyoxylase-like metal-dependent hydrolase (beta-lactamase superfamily II)/rhodanese-related sulfurtransferase